MTDRHAGPNDEIPGTRTRSSQSRSSNTSRRGLLAGAASGAAGAFALAMARPASARGSDNPHSAASKSYVQENFIRYVSDLDALRSVTGMTEGMAAEIVSGGRAGLFRWTASDVSADVRDDPQSGIVVPPHGGDGSAGAWIRVNADPLKAEWFGAVGDGATDDTDALVATYRYHGLSGVRWHISANVYIFAPRGQGVNIGGKTVYYLFATQDGTNITADRGATFKLADNFSNDADPKQLSVFYSTTKTTGFSVDGLAFDLNGANNPISPDRANGNYNKFKHATFWWENDDAGCEDFVYANGAIRNSNGLNCIVAGRSNTEGSKLYSGFKVVNVAFADNGTDAGDHSTIYAWANDVLISRCTFTNTVEVASWPSAYELHGSNSTVSMCRVEGNYQRGGYLAGNYTDTAVGQYVHNNVFRVKSGGSNLFRNPRQKEVRSVHFHHNEVILETGAVSNPNNWRFGFLGQSRNGISDVTVEDNTFRFLDPASDNMVVRVGSGTVAEPADGIHIKNNIAFGAVTGVKIRGADYVDRVYVSGNTFVDFLGGSSCGVEVAGNSKHPPKLVSVTANRFIDDRESAEFANGVHASGKIEALEVDGNAYDGVTGEHVVLQNVSLDRYLGDELRVLAQPPTAGVWETGERVCNASPAAGDFLGWVCVAAGSPGTWRGFGRIEA